MKYVVELVLDIEGNVCRNFNSFHCSEDKIAYMISNWMTKIMWNTGFRETVLIKAMVNDEWDFSDQVNEIRKNPFG